MFIYHDGEQRFVQLFAMEGSALVKRSRNDLILSKGIQASRSELLHREIVPERMLNGIAAGAVVSWVESLEEYS